MAKDTHCSDKCCGSDVKAEDCKCPPTCKHCNCNATNESASAKRWKQTSMPSKEAVAKYGKENVRVKKGALNNGDDMVEVFVESVNEGLADMAGMAERDHEVQMARAELYKIAKYAIKLHEMLKGVSEAEGIEGWMQSKITKAADYMGSVYHTLDYDMATESKKTFKSTMSEADATEYKSALAERVSQKKSQLSELDADTLYKYFNKAYDDVSDRDPKDPKRAKRRDYMKKAAAQHNDKKGWKRPQGVKKSAADAGKSAAGLARHLAKKDMRKDKDED